MWLLDCCSPSNQRDLFIWVQVQIYMYDTSPGRELGCGSPGLPKEVLAESFQR